MLFHSARGCAYFFDTASFYLLHERKAYGYFSFSSEYENLQRITTSYEIAIDFARLEYRCPPHVHEVGGRIRKVAKLANKPLIDLHQYSDNRLCLICPDVFMYLFKTGILTSKIYSKLLLSDKTF